MEPKEVDKLKRGEIYEIWHKRKRHFIAKLLNIIDGDDHDPKFLHVILDVRLGTDQYRLNMGGKDQYRESNLRPSLIEKIKRYDGDNWLREVEIPIEAPQQDKSLINRAIDLFRKGE